MINIYYFTYYFFYMFAKKGNPTPEHYSAGAVLFMLLSHIIFLIGVIKYFGFVHLPIQDPSNNETKLLYVFFILIFYYLADKIFVKKKLHIQEKYDELYLHKDVKLFSVKNVLFIVLLYIVPIIIGAKLISL
jgi:hypothetical protein